MGRAMATSNPPFCLLLDQGKRLGVGGEHIFPQRPERRLSHLVIGRTLERPFWQDSIDMLVLIHVGLKLEARSGLVGDLAVTGSAG